MSELAAYFGDLADVEVPGVRFVKRDQHSKRLNRPRAVDWLKSLSQESFFHDSKRAQTHLVFALSDLALATGEDEVLPIMGSVAIPDGGMEPRTFSTTAQAW